MGYPSLTEAFECLGLIFSHLIKLDYSFQLFPPKQTIVGLSGLLLRRTAEFENGSRSDVLHECIPADLNVLARRGHPCCLPCFLNQWVIPLVLPREVDWHHAQKADAPSDFGSLPVPPALEA